MKAAVLVRKGDAHKAFEIREMEKPSPLAGQVLIEVEGFGLNFADVMARQGLYDDAPPMPSVIGYEVVGRISELGADVTDLEVGQRVVALTRFGGYAEFAVTDQRAAVPISDDMDFGVACALATQYGTAYYSAYEMAPLFEGNHVLVQAAAGGVGTALVQMAKLKGCTVYGTAGSDKKLEYLREQGVDFPINYRKQDFYEVIKKERGEAGLDVVFDSIGGKSVKKGFKLLGAGGRLVSYGVATRSGKSRFNDILMLIGFGLYSPIAFLQNSKGMVGVNMLRIADHRPETLKRCMTNVAQLVMDGQLSPTVGGKYSYKQLAEAHSHLENRKSIGKLAVHWKS